ncbi:hypothetical protein immuto35A_27 [Flavobacterium phage vB_FspM_immuto_3-5A]|jgi:hypothetical protein|uniref:Uncharacterized protein n=1 Tax=Flavobacterium phage vB_FspM_immuto_2-6A TaxID=2801477 RepID=A0A7T8ER78_9CAUD|nr:hypothetical protein KNV73_gp027 [Flavobacterium phage vB_FspM_immuto_2-6A]QQO91706.1 hypothetical protein immuto26A_27 [Flavobacterium phage vB_FspM_immuto_2-6A]QQO91945.1 hypothetical protein immuto35A_27 [Flavobacterium phage vB_FspM_immuto_3-5A]QQO92183.1 hypothetical protein immuto136C_27 [Flavobacterium phage vB_FspM_immuto_13-6C]
MANTCRTDIIIKASKKAIDNFVERFDKCVDGSYPNTENDSPHIIDEFGAKAELLIDRIGSKWVAIWDGGISYHDDREGSSEVHLSLDSAWYPPSDMILEIYRQMAEIDDEVKISGKYWDEVYNPIGVFEVYYGEIIKEEHHDLDETEWDEMVEKENEDYDRNFWDEVVDPLFAHLQKKLDKVMEEI